jgi:molybdopterin synthase sulfur carrier subunit
MKRTVGVADEDVSPPADVKTVGDLVTWLRGRSDGHAEALAEGVAFGAAVDQRTATFDVPITGAREVAFFPPFTGG